MKPYSDKIVVLRSFTSDAVQHISDGSLDFLYVDARHDYCGTSEDLRLYYPKMKAGGIIAGHDYLNSENLATVDGGPKVSNRDWSICLDGTVNRRCVRGAVEEFSKKMGLQIVLAFKDGDWPSYMMRV
jgi:hypothetical protein